MTRRMLVHTQAAAVEAAQQGRDCMHFTLSVYVLQTSDVYTFDISFRKARTEIRCLPIAVNTATITKL